MDLINAKERSGYLYSACTAWLYPKGNRPIFRHPLCYSKQGSKKNGRKGLNVILQDPIFPL